MTKATEICEAVKEALAAGRTVYITDATETRKVIGVEFLSAELGYKYDKQTLDVTMDYGDGETKLWEIAVTWPWDELDGWKMAELDDDLYIAPVWWF